MKKYHLRNVSEHEGNMQHDRAMRNFSFEGGDEMQVSDEYHTMDELYEHRAEVFIALCRYVARSTMTYGLRDNEEVWRSLKHSDGSSYDGWFVMGIGKAKGNQITYHLPAKFWGEVEFAEELETAPEWDGHTANDVLIRLKQF